MAGKFKLTWLWAWEKGISPFHFYYHFLAELAEILSLTSRYWWLGSFLQHKGIPSLLERIWASTCGSIIDSESGLVKSFFIDRESIASGQKLKAEYSSFYFWKNFNTNFELQNGIKLYVSKLRKSEGEGSFWTHPQDWKSKVYETE